MTVIIVLFGMLITNANTYSLLQLPVMHAYIWICEKIFILMLCLKYLILFEVWFSLLSVLQNGAALCREGINLKKKEKDYQSIKNLKN